MLCVWPSVSLLIRYEQKTAIIVMNSLLDEESEIGDLVNYMFTITRSDFWTCEVLSELSWRRLMKLCLVNNLNTETKTIITLTSQISYNVSLLPNLLNFHQINLQ